VLRPLPLLREGRRLNQLGLCCGDVSDGLLREMEKFAAVSGAGARLERDRVPLAEGADWQSALASGEEVELVCVGPRGLVAKAGLTLVGSLVEGGRVSVVDGQGHELEVKDRGHRHFA
jgi:thiamine monophosphate kinase